ncbi:glutathione synthase [Meredithblackwellia eburnea MCA 4105]
MSPPSWPPSLSPVLESHLLSLSSDYALSHGLVLRPPASAPNPPSTTSSIHAPYALVPTPFPRTLFAQAKELQPLYNALYAHVTVDEPFLERVLGGAVSKVDEFQGKLLEIWKVVRKEGIKQPLHLGLFRSDYLIHSPAGTEVGKEEIKQVEFNTISSSFGALATKVGEMHRYLQKSASYPIHSLLSLENLPINNALKGLAAGLAAGHKAYGVSSAKILFVVQDNERNAFDQRALEWELEESHGVSILRLPFSSLHTYTTLSPTTNALLITPPHSPPDAPPTEISVIYFRSGYTPTDYPSQTQWDLRLLLERSTAIKCPTIALQLAGAKKVQQVLASPGEINGFLNKGNTTSTLEPKPTSALTPTDAAKLLTSFTGIYPLDTTPEGLKALHTALTTPEKFVLKPQREGGGNNIYRGDIPGFLNELEAKDVGKEDGEPRGREGYILMDLIEPPVNQIGLMVKAGEDTAREADIVSELGVYGVALFKEREGGEGGAEILVNETVGHLLRTKGRESDEGGVAVGFSVIDSPLLV